MAHKIIPLFLLLATLFGRHLLMQLLAQPTPPPPPTSSDHITLQGCVFCDASHNNTFSRHSYFLPGVDVHIQCKLKANSALKAEEMDFSVNRTTDRFGVYRLEIPSVEGIGCNEGLEIQASCEASLKGSTSSSCNVPGQRSTANRIALKSKLNDHRCIYSFGALSYRPPARNATLCGIGNARRMRFPPYSFNSSKFFFPYLPPYLNIPSWPQLPPFPFSPLPQLPTLPPLPPLPTLPPLPPLLPLPPLTSWPFPQVPNPTRTPSPPYPLTTSSNPQQQHP